MCKVEQGIDFFLKFLKGNSLAKGAEIVLDFKLLNSLQSILNLTWFFEIGLTYRDRLPKINLKKVEILQTFSGNHPTTSF